MSEIEEIRKKSGLSQTEFAKKVGVTRTTIYRWETGEVTPTLENFQKMREVLEEELKKNQENTEESDDLMKTFEDSEGAIVKANVEVKGAETVQREIVYVPVEAKLNWMRILSKIVLVLSFLCVGVSGLFIVMCSSVLYHYYRVIASADKVLSMNPGIPIDICYLTISVCSLLIIGSIYYIVRYFIQRARRKNR